MAGRGKIVQPTWIKNKKIIMKIISITIPAKIKHWVASNITHNTNMITEAKEMQTEEYSITQRDINKIERKEYDPNTYLVYYNNGKIRKVKNVIEVLLGE